MLIVIGAQALRPACPDASPERSRPLPSAVAMRDCSVVTDPRPLPVRPIEQVRERVVEALSEHFARDHLSLDELETRMARVYAATTPADVDALVADLPALAVGAPVIVTPDAYAPTPKLKERLVAIMSGVVRRGLWKIPRRLRVVAIMGGVELDLRQAELPPGVTEITAFVLMGGLEIRVAPGVRLETDGVAIMGGFEDRVHDPGIAPADAPVVRVTGIAIMGGVEAQVQPVD
jgi:hypothetical protein